MNLVFLRPIAELIEAALAAGLRVAVVDERASTAKLSDSVRERVSAYYQVRSFDSVEELCAVGADLQERGFRADRIVCLDEAGQYAAGVLSDLLSVGSSSLRLAASVRDKRRMKRLLREAGVPVARSVSIPDPLDPSYRQRAARELGFPMVIKPANGFGTWSTIKVRDEAELDRALDGFRMENGIISEQLIAEEWIHGEEIYIDSAWQDGQAKVLTISRYAAPRLEAFSRGLINGGWYVRESGKREALRKHRAPRQSGARDPRVPRWLQSL